METVPLRYPDFPDEYSHRVHFLGVGSLRRERSASFATHADATSIQTAPNGDVLVSAAVHTGRTQYFERLVESIGAEGLGINSRKSGGFQGYIDSNQTLIKTPQWDDPQSPWHRISEDNFKAKLYHWSLRRGQLSPSITLPSDFPPIPDSLPWDPDSRFNRILELTESDHLTEAMELVEKIPYSEREILFDEVLYLRFLLGQAPRGGDLAYLARKYILTSAIRGRLNDEFDSFIELLDDVLADSGPIPENFPGFSSLAEIFQDDPDPLKRATPPLSNWQATRKHFYRQLEAYGHPVQPRGRIFVWHPDIGSGSLSRLQRAFRPEFVEAEDRFRKERSIAEIGRGWASETALFDLVRRIYPDTIHQWRPRFLGRQSVDIYVPDLHLAIEYQGEQHYRPIEVFGGEEGFLATKSRDDRKRDVLAANNVKILEWKYNRALTTVEVEDALKAFL